jgi:Flp pilus assembly protein TadD
MLVERGQFDEAVARFELASTLAPEDATIHYHLGCMYAGQRRFDAAETRFRAALRLRPDFGEARASLDRLFAERSR